MFSPYHPMTLQWKPECFTALLSIDYRFILKLWWPNWLFNCILMSRSGWICLRCFACMLACRDSLAQVVVSWGGPKTTWLWSTNWGVICPYSKTLGAWHGMITVPVRLHMPPLLVTLSVQANQSRLIIKNTTQEMASIMLICCSTETVHSWRLQYQVCSIFYFSLSIESVSMWFISCIPFL